MAKISKYELDMLRPVKPVREVNHHIVVYLSFSSWSDCKLSDFSKMVLSEVKAHVDLMKGHAVRHNELVYAQKHLSSAHINTIWDISGGISEDDIQIYCSHHEEGNTLEACIKVSECKVEFAKRMEHYERGVILYKEYLENNEVSVAKIEAAAAKKVEKQKKARIKALKASAKRDEQEADKLLKELQK
jgi:hypothetical protein